MEDQKNFLNPWHDIPPPDTLILRQALEDAFYKYRRNVEQRSLPQILSRLGKQIFFDIIAKPETKAPYIPSNYIPDDWFSDRLKTHLLASTAEAPNNHGKFQVDNSNQYLQYLCHTPEKRVICIARVVHYVRKSSNEEVDVMMVMSWERHNWFVTGYLKAAPSFKHAVRREWARTPARAYLAYLEQNPENVMQHRKANGLGESRDVWQDEDEYDFDADTTAGDTHSLDDSQTYTESYESETATIKSHDDDPVSAEYLADRRHPEEDRIESPYVARSYYDVVQLARQWYGLTEMQVRHLLYKPDL